MCISTPEANRRLGVNFGNGNTMSAKSEENEKWVEIRFKIPARYADAKLSLIRGIKELIAQKHPDDDFWKVKIESCNNCGECCMGLCYSTWPYKLDEEGRCSKLIPDGPEKLVCDAKWETPVRCLFDPPIRSVPNCSIKYESQLVEGSDGQN